MNANEIFYRFSPIVQDFIYANGWETLRPIQVRQPRSFSIRTNILILCSDTASGKTEAVFFPILSQIEGGGAGTVEVLYIAPLKSLINDQFERIDALLRDSGIPVFHWHGDVAASHKNKLIKNPAGVLQITPESLESMLMNRRSDIIRLFGGLKYVIIDEIHTLIGKSTAASDPVPARQDSGNHRLSPAQNRSFRHHRRSGKGAGLAHGRHGPAHADSVRRCGQKQMASRA